MEGTKSITDTLDFARSGRKACCMGRSSGVSSSGPRSNENPDGSSSVTGLEPQSPEGPGFASNVDHLAVSRP